MAASEQTDEEASVRQSERIAVDAPARLHPNDWSSLEVRILDYSATGFRAECEALVKVGSCISLDVPGIGSVDAQVSWRRGGQLGARFLQPVGLERCHWAKAGEASILARLLVQRAEARRTGLWVQEQKIRRQILSSLPIEKGSAAC